MIITVNSQIFASELRPLAKIVPSKPPIPILGYALITAEEGLTLYATDLEVGLRTRCDARVDRSGQIVLPVAKLLELVEWFPDGDVTLASEKAERVSVSCGAFRSTLGTLLPDDFPAVPTLEGAIYPLQAAALERLIDRTRHAVSPRSTTLVLQGALLALTGEAGAMVATDGQRLALATMRYEGAPMRTVLPTKTLDALSHLTGDLTLTLGERSLFFASRDRLLVSRVLEGEFPKHERVVPTENTHVVTVDRFTLTAALRRVLVAAESNEAVYMGLSQGLLTLSARSAEVGSAEEPLEVSYEGPDLRVCTSGRYVLNFLEAATSQHVTLRLKDAQTPALLTDGDDFLEVIMLMRE